MSGIDFESLESYLFAEDKNEFINKLIPNTEPFYFFSLLHDLHNTTNLPTHLEDTASTYDNRFRSTFSDNILLRTLLKKIDDPSTTKEAKLKAINEIATKFFKENMIFNYSKPSNILTSTLNPFQTKRPSSLDPKVARSDFSRDDIYRYSYKIQEFELEALTRIDSSKMMAAPADTIRQFLSVANPADFDDLPTLVTQLMKMDPYYVPSYNDITLEHLMELKKQNPNLNRDAGFLFAVLKKEFGPGSFEDLSQGFSKSEKRDLAFRIYTWASQQEIFLEGLAGRALYEVLQLDLELNKYDKDLLVEYLKIPSITYEYMSTDRGKQQSKAPNVGSYPKAVEEKRSKPKAPSYSKAVEERNIIPSNSGSDFDESEGFVCEDLLGMEQENACEEEEIEMPRKRGSFEQKTSRVRGPRVSDYSLPLQFGAERIPVNNLIKAYLEEFFQSAKDLYPFDVYLDNKYLSTLFYSVKLMLGQAPESTNVLSPDKLKALVESKELSICRYNPEYYKGTDPVVISLRLKNIPSLMVKIFEFQPENYYLKERKKLDGTVNLDGLIAAEEFNIDFKELPARRFIKEIKFDSISQKKQGIFIIDFIGNGLSSRAIIRKGKLSHIKHETLAGQLFSIIDEEANICKGSRTGIWVKDTFYKADDKGRILIPYMSSVISEKAVLVHDDFAELAAIDLRTEAFDFNCTYIYSYESFLMGNKAKVLVQPRLLLNQQPMNLDIIKDCSAIVTTTNNDNIPSKISFDKLKFTEQQELELEFPVPAKMMRVNIEIKVQIIPAGKKEPKEFTSSHSIDVETAINSHIFCNIYLRYSKEGYELYILGRNGEPKKGVTVDLSLKNRYLKNIIPCALETDENGAISLGKLEEIVSIQASVQAIGDITVNSRKWNINDFKSVNYPTNMCICEGEQIILPLLHNELNRHTITFVQILSDKTILRNCLGSLKIDKKKLLISGLKEGSYILYLKDVKKIISIKVLKGNYWSQNPNFLHVKDTLIDIKNDINNIVITDVAVEPKEDSELADITIQAFADQPDLVRFHVFALQFMEFDTNSIVNNMDSKLPRKEPKEVFLGLRKTQIMNNRNLGDEYCYVLNRKSQARYLGNTLEKPGVLIKKTFVRDTQTREEQLSDTQQFKSSVAVRDDEGQRYFTEDIVSQPINSSIRQDIDSFLNFLANPCLVSSNLKMTDEGKIVIHNFPVKRYSFLKIIATNRTSNICEVFPIEKNKIQTKDLTQKARDESLVFSINRTSNNLLKGETIKIKDLTSSEIQIVDSVAKLFDIQKNLASKNSTDSYEKWDFLKDWGRLKYEEKIRKYNKFASHELNLFIYFKDKEFFEGVALPFLQNKVEKTFVDHFLLNNQQVLLKYTSVQKFKDLNSIEKVLLIYSLHAVDAQQAKNLAYSLEQMNQLNKQDINTFKRFFDTALSVKQASDLQPSTSPGHPENLGGFTQPITFSQAGPSLHNFNNMMPMQQMAQISNISNMNFDPFGGPMNMMQQIQPMYDQQMNYHPMQMQSNYMAPTLASANFAYSSAPMMPRGFAPAQMQSRAMPQQAYGRIESKVQYDDDMFDYNMEQVEQRRGQIRQGFQELEKTKEYCERHYYKNPNPNVPVPLNSFWVDAAKHIVDNGFTKPFLTRNFIYAHSSPTEMIAALSIMALPFVAGDHKQSSYEGRGLEIQAGSDLILLIKAVTEVEADLTNDILVIQKFYDPKDRYTDSEEEPGLQVEKEVDQYVINKMYGCTVIVTNSSGSNQQFQVLIEIPEGAIPLKSLGYTKSHTLQLNAYSTQTIEFFFYFSHIGKFKANPPNVSKQGRVIARGKKFEFEVKAEKYYSTMETLNAVLTQGSEEDVLNFARTKNIWNPKIFDFDAIYWLLSNKDFFLKFINILRERKHFNSTVWRFGFCHGDIQTIQEYLDSLPDHSLPQNVFYLNSSIIQIDKFQLFEYHPFVNQRVHLLASEKNRILNVQFKEKYTFFVKYLCERGTLETQHYLGLVYYLLLQDRIEEAIKFFAKINREEVKKNHEYELQYDYFAAYIDFYMGYPSFAVAREVCKKYLDYPVLAWRSLFIDVADQLAEFDGDETVGEEVKTENKRKQNLTNAEKEEIISMEIQKTKINITYQNVKEITLSFYRVDLEVLFSRNPFINQNKDEFSFIRPNEVRKIEGLTAKDLDKIVYEIPETLQKYNLYIELRSENKTQSATYFSTSLEVQIIESYGQVKVLDYQNRPLTKVYVKCFAKAQNGRTSFYKDGYTDLRGRFDYATSNSSDISNIEKFAIFVMSDDYGSLIKEVKPPSKLAKIDSAGIQKYAISKKKKMTKAKLAKEEEYSIGSVDEID